MNYETMLKLTELMEYQLKFLKVMDELIQYDAEYIRQNPEHISAVVPYMGALKSHFTTQKKACEGVKALIERHLPRLKEEYEREHPKSTIQTAGKATMAKAVSKKDNLDKEQSLSLFDSAEGDDGE